MHFAKIVDEGGSAPIEFVVLTALFLAPILSFAQGSNLVFTNKLLATWIANQVVQRVAQFPTDDLRPFVKSIQEDFVTRQIIVDYWCSPNPICSTSSNKVTSRVSVDEDAETVTALRSERGSILLPMLALFAAALLLTMHGINLHLARYCDQKAQSAANGLAMLVADRNEAPREINTAELSASETNQLVVEVLGERLESGVKITSASVSWRDAQTIEAQVCLEVPRLLMLTNATNLIACASSRVRQMKLSASTNEPSTVTRDESGNVTPH